MRILFYYSSRHWSGSARAFAAAASSLSARGHPVTYVCGEESAVEHRLSSGGYDVVALPVGGSWPADSVRLKQVLLDQFVEVVFVHTEREQLVAALATRLAERGAVVRRIPAGGRYSQRAAATFALKLATTGFLFTTDGDAMAAARAAAAAAATASAGAAAGAGAAPSALASGETAGVAIEPIEPVLADIGVSVEELDAVRPVVRANVGAAGATRLLVCVYDPSAARRAASVLRTVALLAPRHPDLRLALIGLGSDHEDLRMHAAALGITEIVSHLGERDDYLSVLRAADLGWVIADLDNAAFGFLDLMALRVPVLAERGPLSMRYAADGITGLLFVPGEPPLTAAKITGLLANEERRVAMGNAGRARVARDFAEETMVDGFERVAEVARDRSRWR